MVSFAAAWPAPGARYGGAMEVLRLHGAKDVRVHQEPEPVAAAMSGPQVYNSACLACHGAGIGGAPVPGDAEAWAARIAQGMDVLKDHAINGFQGSLGYMPAKGGRVDLSDEEVASAVEYMVSESQ